MIGDILKKLFGDKSAKDRKQYQPVIDQTNQFLDQFKQLSDDELRAKTSEFRTTIQAYIAENQAELDELKTKASSAETPIHEKESLFEEIDKLSKALNEKIEEVLETILPQAFAKAARPATSPLKGAVITDFKSTGTNSYSLIYKIGSKLGYVNYSWDANNKFTYTLIDTAGISSTASYQR